MISNSYNIHLPADINEWTKPWTQEQIKAYFVYGDKVSLRKMAAMSGRSINSIGKWFQLPEWIAERNQYLKDLKAEKLRLFLLEEKSQLSKHFLLKVAHENLVSHELERKLAVSAIKLKLSIFDKIDKDLPLDKVISALKFINAADSNYWSLILNRATDGINKTIGLNYFTDINAAFKRLESAGYKIIAPGDDDVISENTESIEDKEREIDIIPNE